MAQIKATTAEDEGVWVLVKQFKSDENAVTIHGYTRNRITAQTWANSSDKNYTFQADFTEAATYEPLDADEW